MAEPKRQPSNPRVRVSRPPQAYAAKKIRAMDKLTKPPKSPIPLVKTKNVPRSTRSKSK